MSLVWIPAFLTLFHIIMVFLWKWIIILALKFATSSLTMIVNTFHYRFLHHQFPLSISWLIPFTATKGYWQQCKLKINFKKCIFGPKLKMKHRRDWRRKQHKKRSNYYFRKKKFMWSTYTLRGVPVSPTQYSNPKYFVLCKTDLL